MSRRGDGRDGAPRSGDSRVRATLNFLRREDGSVSERTLRSGFWVTSSSFIIRSLEFVRSIVLARLLVPDDFGLMGIVYFLIQGFEVFSQTGFNAAIIQRRDRVREAADAAWTIGILRGLVLAGVTLLLAGPVAAFYDEPRLAPIVMAIAGVFVIRGLRNAQMVRLSKDLNFRALTLYQSAITLINILVVVGLAWWTRSVWSLVIGQLSYSALEVLISFLVAERPRLRFPRELIRELFRYGRYITGATIVVFLTTNLDNALIGKVLGMGALGYYVVAYRLANLPATHITNVVSRVMFPAYSQLQEDPDALATAFLKVLRTVAAFTLPAGFGMLLIAPDMVPVVYGERWVPMVLALQILCVFGTVRSLSATTGPIFNAIGRPEIGFFIVSGKLVAILALIYPLTVRYGIVGTSLAVTVPMTLESFVLWGLVSRILACPLGRIVRTLAPSAVATAGMAATVWLVRLRMEPRPGWAFLSTAVALGAASYLLLLVWLDRGLIREWRTRLGGMAGARVGGA